MCGIVGLSLPDNHPNAPGVVRSMTDLIAHRGPDSDGYAASPNGKAHVGFRRLAIRDLNPRANQPMVSASGRSAIVFNGEIYNSAELADRLLPDVRLQTSGDTEVLLELLERYGVAIASELNGMFAFAHVDLASGQVTLCRDRMGMKPLYLFQKSGVCAFASELRALKPFGLEFSAAQVGLFLHFGYSPAPHTFFDHTTQVRPGETVTLLEGEVTSRQRYHQFTNAPWNEAEQDLDQLEALLQSSVELRKLSDVPVGAFLSGGVDSALVAASISSAGSQSVPTFTIAFRDRQHDESQHAAQTATELGLPHHVIEIEERDLPTLALDFLDCYEQPYADTSGLVTMLLCRAVKNHVTVALSGDGGDEFFGGYQRYSWFQKGLMAQRVPGWARQLGSLGVAHANGTRGRRLARWLTARDPAELYAEILRNWNATDIDKLVDPRVMDGRDPVELVREHFQRTDGDSLSKASSFDATYYIPDDLQVKLDRASMKVALEVRCPLLDYRIADYGRLLRSEVKYQRGLKTTLKDLLRRSVSPEVLHRPKHGFNVPLARWLRGPLRDLVSDTLQQRHVQEAGWLHHQTVMQVWNEFLGGQRQHAHHVWMLFGLTHFQSQAAAVPMFTSLLEAFRGRRPGPTSSADGDVSDSNTTFPDAA